MSNSNTPGINLFFSHSVERLADLLSDKIHAQQAQAGLFNAVNVLVPNSNMQRYLQLHVAERKGVCAHVEFPFLETGLFQMTQVITGEDHAHLNGTLLSWKIWAFLKQLDDQGVGVYGPIHDYINYTDSEGLIARKQFQLSQKLAMLLLDYESQRPEMVRSWQHNHLLFENSNDGYLQQLEAMQQKLYQQIVQSENKQKTLLQMANDLQQATCNEAPPAIHIFTPSRISQLHRQLMLQLAEFMPVNIYQLNVCMEYWEDMQTPGEQQWYQSQLTHIARLKVETTDDEGQPYTDENTSQELFSELLSNPDENELLQAWGKPGRETLKLFSEIEHDAAHYSIAFNDHWFESEHNEQGVLQAIQSHIINRVSDTDATIQATHLNSLQFAVAPSIIREVEATYNSILWNLKQNPSLKLNEIAVLVTDMSKYRFVLEQVFESFNHQHQHQLKYAIVDSNAEVESQYAAAVNGLFKVLEDNFIRASLFEWFDNPCVQAANQFDHNDWGHWLQAVDKLGIYCGYDSLYESDDEVSSRLFTWQQGLETLRQSLAFEGTGSVAAAFLSAEKIGQLSVMIESLHSYQQRLQTPKQVNQWEPLINDMLETLIVVSDDHNKEQVVQMSLQHGLQKLSSSQPELVLNYQDIKLFIQHQLQAIPANKGNYLSGGVVCAALQPMRPIPFKLTYILGMDEKSFPGQLNQETLDLTNRSRRIGDINGVENNQYLFLETLMCSREKLYLSYVGIDLVKDEEIMPSPVYLTLKSYCDSTVHFDVLPFKTYPIHQIPLNSNDDACFDVQYLTHSDWLVNFSYGDYLLNQTEKGAVEWPVPLTPAQQLTHEVFQKQHNGKPPEHEDSDGCVKTLMTEINGEALAQYLTNPQIAILRQLGIATKHEDDLSLVDKEPVKLLPLVKHQIFIQAVNEWLLQPATADFNDLIAQQHQIELKQSKAPVSLFAGLNQFSKTADLLKRKLQTKLIDKSFIGGVQVGDSEVDEKAKIKVDAIKLDLVLEPGSDDVVKINSLANNIFTDGDLLSDMVVVSTSSKNTKWNSKLLSPFINWCLWQLSPEIKLAEEFHVHMVFPNKIHSTVLRPWYANDIGFSSQSTIRQYLQNLIRSYSNGQDDFIPVELASQLKIPSKPQQQIRFLGTKSTSKDNVFFAYDQLTADDKAKLLAIYAEKLDWPDYQEVLKAITINQAPQPWLWIRTFLLPLYAMVEGRFEGSDGDLS